ncbi:6-phosphogluconolactonase [Marinihelvus fidelis]|uniref:6-phosphogluconolactonase n=1 Tax=Marinihelvus fidelis TaxID=2613842 RepID=A0A5N0T6N5_9GAMM|nr:6-phosphogluconolactonase [Marinihelvus fidelis]KAA9130461.1 6-phosphogluconolactonase [Marinihelvus fidelis]
MTSAPELIACEDRAEASRVAADLLGGAIAARLKTMTSTSLVVSGGTTPGDCFDLLACRPLDWGRVTVLPSDERWVPASSPDSNEALVRSRLLRARAANGQFLPLFREGIEPEAAPPVVAADIAALPPPHAAVLLGMGADGHFASLFPDFDGLEAALDTSAAPGCVAVRTDGSPHPRISLDLPALLLTDTLVLLFFGDEKRAVYNQALAGEGGYPVQALLAQRQVPVQAVWAP